MFNSFCCARVAAFALCVGTSGSVALGQCDPEWRAGPGVVPLNGDAYVMTHWDPDGVGPSGPWLIVGGNFTMAGATVVNRVAGWDGNMWHSFGTGVNGIVRAVHVLPATNELVVGGDFTQAGGAPAFFLARWNGSSWSPLGGGVNNIVTGLTTLPTGELFVTGSFTVVGGTVASVRAAKWTGTAWNSVANGVAASTFAVTSSGLVYAGGNFNSGASPNVTSWQGPGAGAWTGVGGGLGGCFGGESVGGLAFLSNGDLIAAGDFASARPGCTQMRLVARWNGAMWTEMYSPSLASGAYCIAVTPGDNIFIGTNWTNIWPGAGCTAFRWNSGTSAWDHMGAYFDGGGNPFMLDIEEAPDGALYYCGRFTQMTVNNGATWSPAGYVARYGAPTPIITQQPSDTTTCPMGPGFLTVAATGPGVLSYQWKRNGVPISNEPNHIAGANSPTLTLTNLVPQDAAQYTCAVTNSCGGSESVSATLSISTCDCIDVNNDGSVFDPQDIEAFLSVYSEGPCIPESATCNDIDFNNDGSLFDPCDIDSFLLQFSEGPCTPCGV